MRGTERACVNRDDLHSAVTTMMPTVQGDLERLVRCPSVSAPGYPKDSVLEAAHTALAILRGAGCEAAELVEVEGGSPAVALEIPAPPGAPTVLLYAHYDVQPPGDASVWSSPPFEPTLRDGRLYGRGAADDKSGVVMHAAALRAFAGRPPVGVKLILEGEEETESHLEAFVRRHTDRIRADVMVIADVGNWRIDEPTLTTSLRGLASCIVEVRTLAQPVHSGMFGGPAPDALMVLLRILATLHDDKGNVAVEGLASGKWDGLDYSEATFREISGLLPDVPLIGEGSVSDRLWAKPSVNVVGLDAPPTAEAAVVLVDHAKAIVSLRVVPGDDPVRARGLLARHLETHAPWGVKVSVQEFVAGEGFTTGTDGPGYRAAKRAMADVYGKDVVTVGQGGSIPLVSVLEQSCPEAEIILWGAQDDGARIHSTNESVDLAELERAIEAEALLLLYLAEGAAQAD